ncbi:hypothetical protein AVEN_151087-1 [Araneus ventricosus]|uniref:Uncharacterized protein n=1 Tax=Araneus ventricosus TaxID=182803 RepID=A0A4Y2Q343_ARAVE|nr:hypothetical protein AVEN_151087-1 [Araneus ventricosus]
MKRVTNKMTIHMITKECGLDHRPQAMEPPSANSPDALASVRLPNQAVHVMSFQPRQGGALHDPPDTHATSSNRAQCTSAPF